MTKQPITPREKNSSTRAGKSSSHSTRTTATTTTGTSKGKSTRGAAGSTRNAGGPPKSPSTRNRKPAAPPPPPEPRKLPSFLQVLLEDPDAIRNLRGRLPTWLDELAAAAFVGLGAVMFAALLSAGGEGAISGDVSRTLRQIFGTGAYLISLATIMLGLLILLPKIGLRVGFNWLRLIGLELIFVSIQGLLHAAAFDPEGQALAREGHGGGYVGWAVNHKIFLPLLGEPGNILFLVIGLIIGLHMTAGIRRRHYRQLVNGVSNQIYRLAERIDVEEEIPASVPHVTTPMAIPRAVQEPAYAEMEAEREVFQPRQPQAVPMATANSRATSAVRRAPVEQAESFRARTAPPPAPRINVRPSIPAQALEEASIDVTPSAPFTFETPLPSIPQMREENPEMEIEEIEPYEEMVEERPPLILNGQVVESSFLAKERPSIVPRDTASQQPKPAVMSRHSHRSYKGGRDDDPNKRYFTVEDLQERKKLGKRDDILPPMELLQSYDLSKPDEEEINRNASIIENTLLEFDIDADVIDVKVGPVVTQYAVSPIKEKVNPDTGQIEINRVRVDRIVSLQGDLSLALSAKTLRIEAPVPGHSYVGIEVPNRKPSTVGLRPVLESEHYNNKRKSPLTVPLGRDVSGEVVALDIATLPHLLVAGTTGSGKSVMLTSLVASLVMNNGPEHVKLLMLDPKRVELTRFKGLPHLLGPVETEADRIIGVLRWATREMDHRYKLMELENARNMDAYNTSLGRRRKDEHLPYIVLIFDEIGDLMMSHPDETEGTITRLAQKARAAGIHLVVATQRPSTDILTGLIKANFPGRISFAVASGVDSRVILDYMGAETLLGRGDMLYLAPDAAGPKRIQGCFVSDEEVEEVVAYWNNWREEQVAEGVLDDLRVAPWERGLTRVEAMTDEDPMLEEAITLVLDAKEASTSMIQRRLGIGYPRAARLMDLMFELGVIGPPKAGGRAREVMLKNSRDALKHIKKR
jgi:DNA segregation ATPase FtsK/SpoIIIE-like protein